MKKTMTNKQVVDEWIANPLVVVNVNNHSQTSPMFANNLTIYSYNVNNPLAWYDIDKRAFYVDGNINLYSVTTTRHRNMLAEALNYDQNLARPLLGYATKFVSGEELRGIIREHFENQSKIGVR